MKNIYSVSQSTLYQTCRLIAANCKTKIADFALFSALYTLVYVDAVVAAIDAAEALPGEEARALEHETLRQDMVPLSKTCLKKWQFLKRYITKAYAEEY